MKSRARYIGSRVDGEAVVHVEADGKTVPLKHVGSHSPDGFNWGYEGSGPADLAHSILAHHLAVPHVAPVLYQSFKRDVIARLDQDSGFVLGDAMVSEWLGRRWKNMSEDQIRCDLGTA